MNPFNVYVIAGVVVAMACVIAAIAYYFILLRRKESFMQVSDDPMDAIEEVERREARSETTYRIYATLPTYVYAEVAATSGSMARIKAVREGQWRPSSELDVGGEPVKEIPQVLRVEALDA